ncbi:conserved hypothetical protein [Vibrio chagasii]|nr:conserved hypothetical protein [Vibrio chagasii]
MYELIRFTKEVMTSPKCDEDAEMINFHHERRMKPFHDEELAEWTKELLVKFPSFYTVAATVDCDLNNLFRVTNSIDSNWTENKEVSKVNEDAFLSSTSVGDLFKDLNTNEVYLVANFGFIKMEGLNLPF